MSLLEGGPFVYKKNNASTRSVYPISAVLLRHEAPGDFGAVDGALPIPEGQCWRISQTVMHFVVLEIVNLFCLYVERGNNCLQLVCFIHDFVRQKGVGQFQSSMAGMPQMALPQGFRKGRLSYTVTSSTTGAKIEVLLKQKAFRIQAIGEHDGPWSISKFVSVYIYTTWYWLPDTDPKQNVSSYGSSDHPFLPTSVSSTIVFFSEVSHLLRCPMSSKGLGLEISRNLGISPPRNRDGLWINSCCDVRPCYCFDFEM